MSRGDHVLGERISIGNTSDVWRLSPTTVVKVLHPGIPRHWAGIEADITSKVHAAGLPVPAVEGVVEIKGRPGIVFERIEGESMWDRMEASRREMPRLTEALVGLQMDIHAAQVDGIPSLQARLRVKIEEAEQLSVAERTAALDLLTGLPRGSALCHGDVHPRNILMSSRGAVVVDWFDAATGNPAADCVRTSLLVRPPSPATLSESHLDGATHDFLDRLHQAYLSILTNRGLVDEAEFADWEAVLAVARMSEPVPTADLVRIWEAWRGRSVPASNQAKKARSSRS